MESAYDVAQSLRNFCGKDKSLSEFLQEALLSWKEKPEKDKDGNTLKLITIHSAKGLEYPVVYIAGVEEKIIPHRNSEEENNVDEERRLFYVAMTRAREKLSLSYCKNRISRGQPSPRTISRFIGEIPTELLEKQSPRPLDDYEREEAISNISAMLADF
jgi:superfamily I DNA/RNA helicase